MFQYNILMKKTKINKKLKIFISLFIFGIIIGVIYFNHLDKEKINILVDNITNSKNTFILQNNCIDHIKILSFSSLFSFIFIGILFLFGTIISEGFIYIIRCLLFYKKYKFNGFIFSSLYYILNNLIYLFLLYILFKRICNMTKNLYLFKKKKELSRLNIVLDNITKIIFIILIIFLIDNTIIKALNNVLKLFAFLLK